MRLVEAIKKHVSLFTKQVAKSDDSVRAIFHEVLFCFVANILC